MTVIKRYLSSNEVVEYLQIQKPAFYTYIRKGLITPINKNDWVKDNYFLFEFDDVTKLGELLNKRPSGLTTGEAAKHLNCSINTIRKFVYEGKIKAIKQFYKGKETYFIDKEELKEFESNYKINANKKSFYSREKGLFLYQSLINKITKQKARIMEFKNHKGCAVTEDGKIYNIEQILDIGYEPLNRAKISYKYRQYTGYIKFSFPTPNFYEITSPIYEVIELILQQIEPQNIRLYNQKNRIILESRHCRIQVNDELDYHQTVNLLKEHIVEGNIHIRELERSIYLRSEITSITIPIKKDLKEKIERLAKESNMELSEWVIDCIEKGIKVN